jgi:hypothetical protein
MVGKVLVSTHAGANKTSHDVQMSNWETSKAVG